MSTFQQLILSKIKLSLTRGACRELAPVNPGEVAEILGGRICARGQGPAAFFPVEHCTHPAIFFANALSEEMPIGNNTDAAA